MIKTILAMTLLLAIPAASETVKPPDKQELIKLRDTVRGLQDLIAEHQDRLRAHKMENDNLKKYIGTLESRITVLEKTIGDGDIVRHGGN